MIINSGTSRPRAKITIDGYSDTTHITGITAYCELDTTWTINGGTITIGSTAYTPTLAPKYQVSNWYVDGVSKGTSASGTITGSTITFGAVLVQMATLTFTAQSPGSVSTPSISNVPVGTAYTVSDNVVTVSGIGSCTATASVGAYVFSSWNQSSGTVGGDMTFTASYEQMKIKKAMSSVTYLYSMDMMNNVSHDTTYALCGPSESDYGEIYYTGFGGMENVTSVQATSLTKVSGSWNTNIKDFAVSISDASNFAGVETHATIVTLDTSGNLRMGGLRHVDTNGPIYADPSNPVATGVTDFKMSDKYGCILDSNEGALYESQGYIAYRTSNNFYYKHVSDASFTALGMTVDDYWVTDYDIYYLKNGTLYGMGANTYGELGLGHTNAVSSFTIIKSVSVSAEFSIAVGNYVLMTYEGGRYVYACGLNTNGRLGTGDTANKTSLATVLDLDMYYSPYFSPVITDACIYIKAGSYQSTFSEYKVAGLAPGMSSASNTFIEAPSNVAFGSIGLASTPLGSDGTASIYGLVEDDGSGGYWWWSNLQSYGTNTSDRIGSNLMDLIMPGDQDSATVSIYPTHTLILTNGTLYGSGKNDWGQLGQGNTTSLTQYKSFKFA